MALQICGLHERAHRVGSRGDAEGHVPRGDGRAGDGETPPYPARQWAGGVLTEQDLGDGWRRVRCRDRRAGDHCREQALVLRRRRLVVYGDVGRAGERYFSDLQPEYDILVWLKARIIGLGLNDAADERAVGTTDSDPVLQ